LSKEEVDGLIAPHKDSVDAVESWLQHHDIDVASCHRSDAGDWLRLNVTVTQAERMLGNKYGVYHHVGSSDGVVRAMSYSIPAALMPHISVITPTTYFSTIKSMRATSHLEPEKDIIEAVKPISDVTPPASCASTITPTCLRDLYNTSTYVPKATAKNSLGVAGYLEEFANTADLKVCLVLIAFVSLSLSTDNHHVDLLEQIPHRRCWPDIYHNSG
jgi:tripeptidyl-peptidase I